MARALAIAIVVGCGARAASPPLAFEHEPASWTEPQDPLPNPKRDIGDDDDDDRGPGLRGTEDPTLAARLRTDALRVLPAMASGPVVVFDLDTRASKTLCGASAKQFAHRIAGQLVDPTRPAPSCLRLRTADQVHCQQSDADGGSVEVILQPRDPAKLVGVAVGVAIAFYHSELQQLIDAAKCP